MLTNSIGSTKLIQKKLRKPFLVVLENFAKEKVRSIFCMAVAQMADIYS